MLILVSFIYGIKLAYYINGNILSMEGYMTTINYFAYALRRNPNDTNLLKVFAKHLIREKQFKNAVKVIEQLRKQDPDFETIELYAQALIGVGNRVSLLKAIAALNLLNLDANFDRNKAFEVKKSLGNCYMQLEHYQAAKVFYENCLLLNPNSDVIYSNIAVIHFQKREYEKSMELFNKALEINSENIEALTGLSMCLWELSNYTASIDTAKEVLEADVSNLNAINLVVKAAYLTQDLDFAKKYLEKYLEANPTNVEMIYTYAGILYQQQDIGLAYDLLKKALIIDPEHKFSQELLAIIERTYYNDGNSNNAFVSNYLGGLRKRA
jgi:tetratricopeptide (TPR) repeat protein